MSYTINDIDLATAFGFVAGQAQGSNLGVSGCWDMPARIGKTHHTWGDANGVEPYVAASEIRFGGRDIVLHGVFNANDASSVFTAVAEFSIFIDELFELVELSCDWGTWSVLVSGKVSITYQGQGVATVSIPFREPVVDMSGAAEPADYTDDQLPETNIYLIDGIDDITFDTYGATLLSVKNRLDIPAPQREAVTAYQTEGAKVTKTLNRELNLKFLITAADYSGFNTYLKGFYALFLKAGMRYLTVAGQSVGQFFVPDGFKVSDVLVRDGVVHGLLEVAIQYTGNGLPDIVLIDNDGAILIDEDGAYLTDTYSWRT